MKQGKLLVGEGYLFELARKDYITVPTIEDSLDIGLHPIFGDEASQKKNFREGLYKLKLDNGYDRTALPA